ERSDAQLSGDPYPRILDIDGLPATPLATGRTQWPRHVATDNDVRSILSLVCRTAGATMPGLLAAPCCEISMPAVHPGTYHRVQVLIDGEFIRVYPDGDERAGVVYPVEDPPALRSLIESLPLIP